MIYPPSPENSLPDNNGIHEKTRANSVGVFEDCGVWGWPHVNLKQTRARICGMAGDCPAPKHRVAAGRRAKPGARFIQ